MWELIELPHFDKIKSDVQKSEGIERCAQVKIEIKKFKIEKSADFKVHSKMECGEMQDEFSGLHGNDLNADILLTKIQNRMI